MRSSISAANEDTLQNGSNRIRSDRATALVCCDASECSFCSAPPEVGAPKLWVSLISPLQRLKLWVSFISVELEGVLDRFGIDARHWAGNVRSYGSLFYRIAGKVEQLLGYAQRRGQAWFCGQAGSDRLYTARKQA